MPNKQRKKGFDTLDIKERSFMQGRGIRTTPVAKPVAHYGIPKDTTSGDALALVDTLRNITKVIPDAEKLLVKKGADASLRGEKRPEGLFSLPIQQGWDYTEGQALEGTIYSTYDQRLQKLAAKFNGKNPDEFREQVQKMMKNLNKGFTDKASDAKLAGMQGALAKVTRDTSVVTESIISKKVGENGLANMKSMYTQRLIEIHNSGADAEMKRLASHYEIKEMQKLGREKYGLDNNAVTNALVEAVQASADRNPALYEPFYLTDEDGIAPKDTEGGKKVDGLYQKALEKAELEAPSKAYKVLRSMPEFFNVDKSFNYAKAKAYVDDPNNWQSLDIKDLTDAREVKAYMNNSYVSTEAEKAKVKEEYTTKTLNKAFDMVYKSKTQNTNDAIAFIKASNIDGHVKFKIISGLLKKSKSGSSYKFNTALSDILEGEITHKSAIYELMGHDTGVTIEEGNKLISFFNKVNAPEINALKATVKEVYNVLTKGGIQLDAYSSIRQAAAKKASLWVLDEADRLQKEGKPVDWSKLAQTAINNNTPSRQDELKILAGSFASARRGQENLQKTQAAGTTITVGKGKSSFKVSPNLNSFEDFVADVVARKNQGATHVINAEGLGKLMSDPKSREFLMTAYQDYQATKLQSK